MTFNPVTEPVDHILLAEQRSPGIADVLGANSAREFTQRRGYGLSGATLRFRGTPLADFVVKLRLYTQQDWDGWHDWRSLVARPTAEAYRPPNTSDLKPQDLPPALRRLRAPPMDIWHPILEDLEIRSAVVTDVLQPLQTADGEWTIEIRFLEYRAPLPALESTAGSQAARPLTETEQRIQLLHFELDDQTQLYARGQ